MEEDAKWNGYFNSGDSKSVCESVSNMIKTENLSIDAVDKTCAYYAICDQTLQGDQTDQSYQTNQGDQTDQTLQGDQTHQTDKDDQTYRPW